VAKQHANTFDWSRRSSIKYDKRSDSAPPRREHRRDLNGKVTSEGVADQMDITDRCLLLNSSRE